MPVRVPVRVLVCELVRVRVLARPGLVVRASEPPAAAAAGLNLALDELVPGWRPVPLPLDAAAAGDGVVDVAGSLRLWLGLDVDRCGDDDEAQREARLGLAFGTASAEPPL